MVGLRLPPSNSPFDTLPETLQLVYALFRGRYTFQPGESLLDLSCHSTLFQLASGGCSRRPASALRGARAKLGNLRIMFELFRKSFWSNVGHAPGAVCLDPVGMATELDAIPVVSARIQPV